jgi:hypothetical protein
MFDMPTIKIENVFVGDEIEKIYNHVDKALYGIGPDSEEGHYFFNAKDVGYFAVFGFPSTKFYDRLHEIAEEYSGYSLSKDSQIHFARYTTNTGAEPRLRPHYDGMLKSETITLSVQLKKNIDWLIYCNGEPASIDTNEAILFSGSHQIHWRPQRKFVDGEFLDVLVCQFPIVGGSDLPEGHEDRMHKIREPFIDIYGSVED